MVVYVPGQPGFGSGLGTGISQGIAAGLENLLKQTAEKRRTNQLMQMLGISMPQAGEGASQVEGLAPTQLPGTEATGDPAEMQERISRLNLTPEQVTALTLFDPQIGRTAASLYKTQQTEKERAEAPYTKAAEKYWTNLQEQADSLPEAEFALQSQMDAVMSGEVDPFSRGNWVEIGKGLGVPASLLGGLETPGSKEFKTAQKTFLSRIMRDTFRGTTTQREIDTAEAMMAQVGLSKDANLAALWAMQSKYMLQREKIRLSRDLKKRGVRASDIPERVDEALDKYRKDLSKQYFEAIKELSKKK